MWPSDCPTSCQCTCSAPQSETTPRNPPPTVTSSSGLPLGPRRRTALRVARVPGRNASSSTPSGPQRTCPGNGSSTDLTRTTSDTAGCDWASGRSGGRGGAGCKNSWLSFRHYPQKRNDWRRGGRVQWRRAGGRKGFRAAYHPAASANPDVGRLIFRVKNPSSGRHVFLASESVAVERKSGRLIDSEQNLQDK